jgi:serine/threonine protein kinase/predicted ATPase
MHKSPSEGESSVLCPKCGQPNAEFSPRCQACGEPLPADSGLAVPPRPVAAAEATRSSRPPEETLSGRSLSHYRLLEPLGRGSMGLVYRAEDQRSGRLVALKTVAVPYQGLLSSIRREIEALSRIRHPGIVRILESGTSEGMPWYAMELLEGQTLRRWGQGVTDEAETADERWWTQSLEANALTPSPRSEGDGPVDRPAARFLSPLGSEARGERRAGSQEAKDSGGGSLVAVLTVVRRLCGPLAYLHGEGLVHRDLKPDNVVLRAASRERAAPAPWPVLVDFGLSAPSGPGREALQLDSGAAGTPLYMAPEQIRGEPLDARADLYALGCILYELLTGRPPFVGRSAGELLRKHLEDEPIPPSRLAPEVEAHPDGPRLDALVLRLLAKSPRERIGYADDVAAALASLGAGTGSEARDAPQPRAYLYRPGFCGRETVLEELSGRLERLEAGRGGTVLIGGESGVGKTRLLVELSREAARRSLLVLAGECLDTGAQPLEALRKPLQQVADRCRERGRSETDRVLGRRGKVLAQYEPALGTLPGQEAYPEPAELPAEAARLRLFSYLAETFAALTRASASAALSEDEARPARPSTPLVLILDDLQWADELVLGFLELWLRSAAGVHSRTPLLLVGAYRSEEAGEGLRKLLGSEGVERLPLGRLEEPAVAEMVAGMLALEPAPQVFSRYLTRQSEGNPFFVAEYLRTAVAEGLLWRDGQGHWQVGRSGERPAAEADYEALPLPRSLRELVGRRLQGLPEPALRLTEAAAVLGRETEAALLRPMLRLEETAFSAAVSELLRRQVLEQSGPKELRFVHDKIREVAYESIVSEGRSELNRAAAEAIEAVYGRESAEQMAALGHHWEEAGEPEKARPSYLAAARRAAGKYDLAEAERLYRAYLGLVEEPTVESVTARNELAEKVLQLCSRNEQALSEHRCALEEARIIGDRHSEAQVLQQQGRIHWFTGRPEEARQLYEEALAIHRALGDQQYEGVVLGNMGLLCKEQGRPEEARQLYEQALAIHREVGDRQFEGVALGNLGTLQAEQGRPEEARQLYEQAVAIHREVGNRPGEGTVLGNLGTLRAGQGWLEEACQLEEQALAIHREVGNRRSEGIMLCNLGNVYWDQGRSEEARQAYQQALAISRELGGRRDEGIALGNLGDLHREEGRLKEAGQCYEQALAIQCEVGNRISEGYMLGNLGDLRMEQGRPEEARQLLEGALTILRETDSRRYEGLQFHSLACLARLATGDLATATHWAEQGEVHLKDVSEAPALGQLLCERGHIELAAGRSGLDLLKRAQALPETSGAGPKSILGKAISKLRRAIEASAAGQHHRLFRGELIEDIPEGLRRWLVETGQLPG